MKKIATTLTLFLLLLPTLFSQIHINEYSASNLHGFLDNYNRTEDWIELFNGANIDIDISGYYLSDKEDNPEKWVIPAGTVIPANGFLIFWCSGRDEVSNGNYHTNFKLAQTKNNEVLVLSNSSGELIEEYPLELTLVENSIARATDGDGDWMVCTAPTLGESNNNSPLFERYTTAPSMDQDAGFYMDEITVQITNNDPDAVVRYTLDGTNPTEFSPVYETPLTITETTVVKARAFSDSESVLPGKMDFNTYFINEDFTLAVFSVAADEVIDLANGDGDLIPIGSLEYFNIDKEREATSFGSLNRHGQDSWVLPHRSIDWVSRDEMGYSKAVNAPLFSYSERDEYQKFMFRNSGDDNYPAINDFSHQGSTHIRDEYVQALAHQGNLKLDQRAVERVILFLNGEYWGVYGMRERPVDHDYTDEYYDQGKYDLQYLTTWGDTEAEYGGNQAFQDWFELRDFILENDMSDPDNYEMVTDQYQVLSLIDYMIVNLNCVASDWLNYNTGWWRGMDPEGDHKKWGYILWDLDATFDYYINYSGVPNISPTAQPCDIEDISDYMDDFFDEPTMSDTIITNPEECQTVLNGSSPYPVTDTIFLQVLNADNYCCETEWDGICQDAYDFLVENPEGVVEMGGNVGKHEKIFLKLQEESDEFRQLYYSRQADLANTVYSCENMITTLDSMLNVIEPEMPRQIERWGGSMQEWSENVQDLKDFILARCELFDEGMVDCFELTGPFELTLNVIPEGAGEIDLNTLDIENFPWTGSYYGGMENLIKARAFDEELYEFSHWETTSGNPIFPDSLERKASIHLESSETLTAVFTSLVSIEELAPQIEMSVFPNPASNQVTVNYKLEEAAEVTISLYTLMGKKVNDIGLKKSRRPAGEHSQILRFENQVPPGVYFLQLTAGQSQVNKKVIII